MSSERRTDASVLLSKAAQKSKSPRLAALAVKVRLDASSVQRKAINDIVTALLKEKADEIKRKDFGTDEFNTNQMQTEKKEH